MSSQRPRILCADDDQDTVQTIRRMLEQAGYEVTTAHSIAETTTLATSEHFDLYLLDNRFLDGTGIDLCQQLRAFNPQTPILFLSGVGGESVRKYALEMGAQEYLVKPDGMDKLVATVERLIAGAKD